MMEWDQRRKRRQNQRTWVATPCLVLLLCFTGIAPADAFLSRVPRHHPTVPITQARPYHSNVRLYAKEKKRRVPYSLGGTPYLATKERSKDKRPKEQVETNTTESAVNATHTATNLTHQEEYANTAATLGIHTVLRSPKDTAAHNESLALNESLAHVAESNNNNLTNISNESTPTLFATKPVAKKEAPSFFSLEHYYNITRFNASAYRSKTKPAPAPEPLILPNKKPDDVVTVADLEAILKQNGYVRQTPQKQSQFALQDRQREATPTLKSKTKGEGIAFPQASVLSYRDVTAGSTISGGFLGFVLGITMYPSLWLIGMVLGGSFGYDVAQKFHTSHTDPTNILSKSVLSMGRRLAKACLKVYDFLKGIWFMYKTGQLSYEYYKRYAALDQRFQVQDKIDAWNARFQQGKIAFDKWERENEVGRKALATLRTFWLVQEDSVKKERRRYGGRKSRYRIVQYAYDILAWCRRLVVALWNAVTGGGSSELQELARGMRINLGSVEAWGPRLRAAAAALCGCYCVGVMFAVAPMVLGSLAIAMGILFPTWIQSAFDSFVELLEETRARGRGEDSTTTAKVDATARRKKKKEKPPPFDKSRYHFFVREDGTKRWYRTGQPYPLFDRRPLQPEKKGLFGFFKGSDSNTSSKKEKKRKENGQWELWNFDF